MISIFPDGYRPTVPDLAERDGACTALGARPDREEEFVPVGPGAGLRYGEPPTGDCDATGLRAGILRRLGMDDQGIAAELNLGQAEVRFLHKLEQLRSADQPDKLVTPARTFLKRKPEFATVVPCILQGEGINRED